MGKVVPIRFDGRHTEKSPQLSSSAKDYLAQELADIIQELETYKDGFFRVVIEARGYPPELLRRIEALLNA